MRVRAAGSSGVTTVNAVQTTAEGEGGREGGGQKAAYKEKQRHPEGRTSTEG